MKKYYNTAHTLCILCLSQLTASIDTCTADVNTKWVVATLIFTDSFIACVVIIWAQNTSTIAVIQKKNFTKIVYNYGCIVISTIISYIL